jgi:hypothetical protein
MQVFIGRSSSTSAWLSTRNFIAPRVYGSLRDAVAALRSGAFIGLQGRATTKRTFRVRPQRYVATDQC